MPALAMLSINWYDDAPPVTFNVSHIGTYFTANELVDLWVVVQLPTMMSVHEIVSTDHRQSDKYKLLHNYMLITF